MWLFNNFQLATPLVNGNILSLAKAAAFIDDSGKISWIGPAADFEKQQLQKLFFASDAKPQCIDLAGRLVTPGLIDCHTHLTFAGQRADEFQRRLAGESYESIARSGGGILNTVQATRNASEQDLSAQTLKRLASWLNRGVTTVEIKSGYGLNTAEEVKILKAIAAAKQHHLGTVVATFLGAHAVPPEYKTNRAAYVDLVCTEMLPEVARLNLAAAADVFCETIAFSLQETRQILQAAMMCGIRSKLHAEQLSLSHAAALAAEFKLLSCDHLEHLDSAGAQAMQAAQSVAVLLPGSFYYLRETRKPPVALLRSFGIPFAVATDYNPGSSPLASLLLAAHMACIFFEISVTEAFQAVTVNAARALGMQNSKGILQEGFDADFAVWNAGSLAELFYETGTNPCAGVFVRDKWLPRENFAQESFESATH